ncbi:GTP diphosphokinase [Thorsellia kenyensis]|uniref:GTP pyrophosphokinase n=1 Tax=Thorsellia kenyensis TaxID=1549888 RepID=A0ABV6CAD4_9GAMM
MVAIRKIHLSASGDLDIQSWFDSLSLSNKDASLHLSEIWFFLLSLVQPKFKLNFAPEALSDTSILYDQSPSKHLLHQLLILRGLEMVEILASLNMDKETLGASLLFPWLQEKEISPEAIEEKFGHKTLQLINGVIQMNNIRLLKSAEIDRMKSAQIDNMRKMLLSMVEDFRCVVIALADRIVHLREVKDAPEDERVLAAKECSSIYAPLANRLGIGQLKWELEDYCFRYLQPAKYKQIASLLHERRLDREEYIKEFVLKLHAAMVSENIKAEIYGRPKHIYSIWRKMQKKHVDFDELYDVRAIRIVVERLQDCYAALGVVHTQFKHLPKEFDDYIANPKPNGYQSIHTVVLGPGGKTLEIQIRTRQMHEDAELGVAAHWKYKEGGGSAPKSSLEERIDWLRKLLNWQEEMVDTGDMLEEVRSQVFDDRVYVFTPKGDVIDLPAGSTPLDFAYHIHSDIGHRCIGAKVAGRIVPFTYQLQMGDQIDIITQKNPNPSRDWLNPHLGYITTSRGRSKVQNWFRKQEKDKNILLGKQILENELQHLSLTLREVEKSLLKKYNSPSMDEFLASLGAGDVRLQQMINFIQNQFIKVTAKEEDEAALKIINETVNQNKAKSEPNNAKNSGLNSGRVVIENVGNLLHHLAGCCQPIIGDSISGFITQGRGISIHRTDCNQLAELQSVHPERIVEAKWGESYSSGHKLTLRISAYDRSGLLRDITTILANEKINVFNFKSHSDLKTQTATIDMQIEIYNLDVLSRATNKIKQINDVIEVKRL